MPGKVIIDHYTKVKKLEEQLESEIDVIINQIDVRSLVSNPDGELGQIVDIIAQLIADEYIQKATELGIDFGRLIEGKIEKDQEITVEVGTIEEKEKEFKS